MHQNPYVLALLSNGKDAILKSKRHFGQIQMQKATLRMWRNGSYYLEGYNHGPAV
jgi:hypothetical protein